MIIFTHLYDYFYDFLSCKPQKAVCMPSFYTLTLIVIQKSTLNLLYVRNLSQFTSIGVINIYCLQNTDIDPYNNEY